MKYIIKINGVWILKDNNTKDFSDTIDVDADNIPELKQKFEDYLSDEAFKRGYKSVTGIIESVKKLDWETIAQDRDYSGTFVNTDNVQIDLNS